MKGGIYLIRNKVNGKVYIGKTKHFQQRKDEHIRKLNAEIHRNNHLENAWHKYGQDNFEFKLILEVDDEKQRMKWEDWFFNNCNQDDLYNIRLSSDYSEIAEETKEKLSKANSGKNHGMYGKTHTKEAREEISKAMQGRESPTLGMSWEMDEESKENLSESKKGEKNPQSKLNNVAVKVIKYFLKNSEKTHSEIASVHNVNNSVITRINTNEYWSHISLEGD